MLPPQDGARPNGRASRPLRLVAAQKNALHTVAPQGRLLWSRLRKTRSILSRLKKQELTPWAHEPSFRVLHEVIQRGHICDREALHAIQEPQLHKICLEKCPRRFQNQ